MKKFIRKFISTLLGSIDSLEKEKKELEEELKLIERKKNFQKEHEKRRELLGCKTNSQNELHEEEVEIENPNIFSLLNLALPKLCCIILAPFFLPWVFVKINIPIPVVEILVGLILVMYFHIEIKNMPKKLIYKSSWVKYVIAFLIPAIFYTVAPMIISFDPKTVELFLLRKFYIRNLNYIGLGVIFFLASSTRILAFTLRKAIRK